MVVESEVETGCQLNPLSCRVWMSHAGSIEHLPQDMRAKAAPSVSAAVLRGQCGVSDSREEHHFLAKWKSSTGLLEAELNSKRHKLLLLQ